MSDDSTSGYFNTLTSPKVNDNNSLILNAHKFKDLLYKEPLY